MTSRTIDTLKARAAEAAKTYAAAFGTSDRDFAEWLTAAYETDAANIPEVPNNAYAEIYRPAFNAALKQLHRSNPTRKVERTTFAWNVPAALFEGRTATDPILPIEIQQVQDGHYYAVYDGEPDVEYRSLEDLAVAHRIDVDHETLGTWPKHIYPRSILVNA
jgi:hypothetical protein